MAEFWNPTGSSAQASGAAHDALVTLTDGGIPSGIITPAAVAAQAARVPGVYAAVAPATPDYQRAGTVIVTVLPTAESGVSAGQTTVAALEHTLVGSPHVIGVGGDGASLIDFDHAIYSDFPLMLAITGVATFLLLVRAFRSVLLAAKAVAFNLISLAAVYGVLTWVWQDDHGSRALWGIPATGAITMWVPLMVFAFLFGLSMDYEVFTLSRIRQAYDAGVGRGDPPHQTVVLAVGVGVLQSQFGLADPAQPVHRLRHHRPAPRLQRPLEHAQRLIAALEHPHRAARQPGHRAGQVHRGRMRHGERSGRAERLARHPRPRPGGRGAGCGCVSGHWPSASDIL